jgi:hypothetical protein
MKAESWAEKDRNERQYNDEKQKTEKERKILCISDKEKGQYEVVKT